MIKIEDAYEMFVKSPSTLILGFIQCPCAGCVWLREARRVSGVDLMINKLDTRGCNLWKKP